MSTPATAEEKINKKNDVKARGLLLMALPNEHQLTIPYHIQSKSIKIHEDDLEAMDLKWQLSLLSVRAKKYYQKTGKKIFINGNDIAGYDKSKGLGYYESTTCPHIDEEMRQATNHNDKDLLTVDAQAHDCLKFAEMHNVVAFLENPKESDGFAKIIDFLKASSVSYALTVNPVIYTSCIEQFWATAKVQTDNECNRYKAASYKKMVIVMESTLGVNLSLDECRRITPLFDTMMIQPVEEIGEDSDHPTDSTPIPIIDQPSSSS
ncbi:hypothetical protein Tco_0005823 [Tanacetum coccineum]